MTIPWDDEREFAYRIEREVGLQHALTEARSEIERHHALIAEMRTRFAGALNLIADHGSGQADQSPCLSCARLAAEWRSWLNREVG